MSESNTNGRDWNLMGFDIKSYMNQSDVSNNRKISAEIEMIAINRLLPSPENIYGIRDIEELAASIEMDGLLHNLVVKAVNERGFHEIISGERRYRACMFLNEKKPGSFDFLPCKVITESDPLRDKLRLLQANASARILTDYEKAAQALEIKEILQKLKLQGEDIPGRLRNHIAEAMGVSASQVNRFDSVMKKLIPEWLEEFKNEKIQISTAYDLSVMPESEQRKAFESYKVSGSLEKNSPKKSRVAAEKRKEANISEGKSPKLDIDRKATIEGLRDLAGMYKDVSEARKILLDAVTLLEMRR